MDGKSKKEIMSRKNITLELPFRYINHSDSEKTFANELTPVNSINLSNILSENSGCRHVIVYESNDDILAFIILWDHGTHFEVELVEANRACQTKIKAGAALLLLTERLSKKLNYDKIVLYSVQNLIPYYRNHHQYELTDEIIMDPTYGPLTKMIKNL
ncbi:MAG: hypothetical protein KGL95_11345 [Patescibacteria group bacterium]|nr:hypothetical protein [Patescibacteria group bacterium]